MDHSTTEILAYIPKFLQKQISPFTRLKTLVVDDGNVGDEVKNYFMRGRSGEVSEVVKLESMKLDQSFRLQTTGFRLLMKVELVECKYFYDEEVIKPFGGLLCLEDLILDVVHCDPEDEYKKRFRISGERLVNLKVRFIHFDRIEVYAPNLKSFFFHKVDFVHEFLELTLPSLDHVDIMLYGQGFEYLDDLRTHIITFFTGLCTVTSLVLDHSTIEILDYILKFLQKQISPFTRLKTLVVEDGNVGDEVKNYFIRGRSGEVPEVVKWGTDIGCEAYNTLKRVIEYVLSHGIENLSMNLLVGFDSSEPIYAFSKFFNKVLNDEDLILDVVHCDPEDEYKKRFRISGERLVNLKVRFIHFDRIEVYAPNLKSFFFHKVDFVHEFLELTLPSLDHVDIMLYGQGFEYLDDLRTHIITFFTGLCTVTSLALDHSTTEILDYILKFLQKQISPFTRLKTLVVEDVNVGDEVKNYFIRGRSGEVSEVVKIAEYLILDVVHCDPEDEYKKRFRISGERLVNLKVRFIHFDRIEVYTPNLKSFFFHKVDFVHEFLDLTLPSLDHVDITLYGQGFEYLDDLRTHISSLSSAVCVLLKTLVVEEGNVGDEVKNYFIGGRSGEVSKVVKWGIDNGCEAYNTLKRVIEYVLSHGIENLSMNLLVGFDSSEPVYAFSKLFSKVLNDDGMLILKLESMKLDQSFRLQTTGFRLLMKVELVECKYFYDEEVIKPFGGLLCLEDLVLDVVHCDPEDEYKKRFRISGERLVNLKVRFIHFDRIEVYAPNLKSFFFHKVDFVHEFLELTLPSLDHVDIMLYGQGFEYLDDLRTHIITFFTGLCTVTSLVLDHSTIEILDYILKFLQKQISHFTRLKTLVVEDGNVGDEVKNYFIRGRSGEVPEVVKWGTDIGCEAYNTLKRVIEYVLSHGIENLSMNLLVGFDSSEPIYAFSKFFNKVLNDEDLILDVVHCDPEDEYKKRFRISRERLVNLKVRFIHFDRIEVYAPNLKSFFFHKVDFVHEFLELTLPSLDHVDIMLYGQGFEYLDDLRTHIITFFTGLCTVTSLALDHSTTEILDYILKFLQKQISPFTRLKTLVVEDVNVGDEVKNYFIRGRSDLILDVVHCDPEDEYKKRFRISGERLVNLKVRFIHFDRIEVYTPNLKSFFFHKVDFVHEFLDLTLPSLDHVDITLYGQGFEYLDDLRTHISSLSSAVCVLLKTLVVEEGNVGDEVKNYFIGGRSGEVSKVVKWGIDNGCEAYNTLKRVIEYVLSHGIENLSMNLLVGFDSSEPVYAFSKLFSKVLNDEGMLILKLESMKLDQSFRLQTTGFWLLMKVELVECKYFYDEEVIKPFGGLLCLEDLILDVVHCDPEDEYKKRFRISGERLVNLKVRFIHFDRIEVYAPNLKSFFFHKVDFVHEFLELTLPSLDHVDITLYGQGFECLDDLRTHISSLSSEILAYIPKFLQKQISPFTRLKTLVVEDGNVGDEVKNYFMRGRSGEVSEVVKWGTGIGCEAYNTLKRVIEYVLSHGIENLSMNLLVGFDSSEPVYAFSKLFSKVLNDEGMLIMKLESMKLDQSFRLQTTGFRLLMKVELVECKYFYDEEVIKPFGGLLCLEDLILDVVHCDPEDEYKKRFRISGERLVNLKVRFIHFDRIEVYAPNLKSFFFHKVDFVHEFLELTLPSLDHVDITLYGQGFEYLDDLRTHISSLSSAILDYILKFLQKQISPFTRLKTLVVEDGNVGDEVKNYFMRGRSGEVSEVVKWGTGIGCEAYNTLKRVIEYVLSHGIENLSMNLLVGFDSSEPVYAFSKLFSKVLNDEGMLILKLESMKLDQSFRLQTTGFRLLMKVELVECKYFYDEEVIKPFGGLLCLEDLILDVVHCDPEDEYKKRFRISGERLVNLKVRFIHFDRIEVYAPNLKSFFFHKVDFVHEFLELTLPSLDHVDIMLYGQGFEYLDDLSTHIITFFTGLCTVTSLPLDHSTTEILDYILKFLQKQISPFTRVKTVVVEDGNVGDEVKNYFIRGRSGEVSEVVKWGTGIGCEAHNTLKRVIEYVLSHGIENLSMNLLVGFDSSEPIYAFSKFFNKVLNDEDLILDVVHCDPEDEYKKRFRISGERLVNLKVRFIHFDRIEVYAPNLKSFFFHKVDFVHEFLELTLPSLDHVDITLYGQALPYLVHLSWCFLSFFALILDYIPKFLQKQILPFTRLKTLVVEDGNVGDEVKNYFMRGRSGEVSEVVKEKEYKDALEAFNDKNKKKVQLITKLMEVELVECKYFYDEEVIKPFGGLLCLEDLILDVVHCDPEDEYKKRFGISGERLVNLKVRFIHFDRIEVYAPNLKSFFFHKVYFVNEFLELTLPSLDHVDIMLYGQGFEYLDDLRTHIITFFTGLCTVTSLALDHSTTEILDYILKFLQKQISPFTRLKMLVVEDGNVGDEVKNYIIRGRSGKCQKWSRVIEYVLSHGIENLSMNLLVGFDSSEPIYAFSKFFNKVLNDEDLILDVVHCDPEDEYKKRFRISGERLVNLKVRFIHFDRIEVYAPNLKSFFFHKVDFVHEFLELTLPSLDHVDITLYGQGFEYLDDLRTHISSLSSAILDYIPKFLQKQISPFTRLKTLVVEDGNVGDEVKNYFMRGRSGEVSEVVKILDYIPKFLQKQISPFTRLKTLVVEDGNVGDEVKNYFMRGRSGEVSEVVKVEIRDRVIEYVLSHGIENLSKNLLVGFDSSEPVYAFSKSFSKVLNDEGMLILKLESMKLDQSFRLQTTGFRLLMKVELVECKYFYDEEVIKPFGGLLCLEDLILDVVHCDPEDEYKKRFRISGERLVNLKVRFIHFDRIEVYAPNLKSFFFHKVDFVNEFLELTLPSLDHVDIMLYGQGFEYLDDLRTHIITFFTGLCTVTSLALDHSTTEILDYILKFLQKQISPFTRLKTLVVEDGNVGDEVKNYFIRGRSGKCQKWSRIEVYAPNLKSFFFHKVDFVHEFLELTLHSLDHVDITLYGQGFEYLDDLRTHISSLSSAILDYIPKFLQKQISPFTRLKTLVVEDGNVGDEVKNYFMRGRSGEVSEVVKVEIRDRVIEYVLSHGIENLSKNLLVGFDSSEPVYAFSKSFSKVLNDEGMLILKLESMKLDQSFRLQTTGFRLLMKVELVECKYFYDEEVIKPFGGLLCLEDLILDVVHCDPEDEYKKRFRISGERLVNLKVRFIHFDRIEVYAPNLKSFFFHKVDFVNEFLELTLPSLDHVDIMLYGQGFEYLDDLRTHIITFFTGLCTVTSLALDHSTTEILDYILKFLQKQISPFTRLKTLVVEDGNVGDEVKNYFIRGRSGKCQKWSRIEVYATNLKSFFFHKVDFVHEFLELTLPSLDHVDIMLYGQGFEYLDDLRTHISSLFSAILDYIPKFLQKQISPFTRLKTLVVEDGNAGDEVKNYFMRGRSGEVSEVVKVEICDRVIEYVLSHGIENLSKNLLVGFDSSEPVYAFSKSFSKVLNDEGMLILKLESMKLDQSFRLQTTGFRLLMKVELVECKYFYDEEVIKPFGGLLCLEDLILDVVHCDPEDEYKKRFRISGERLVNLKVRFIHFDRIEVYAPNRKSFFFHKVDFVNEFLELTLPSLDHVDIMLYGQGFEYLDDLRTHIITFFTGLCTVTSLALDHSTTEILDYILKFLQKQISPFTRLKTLVVEDGNVGDEVKNYFIRGRSGKCQKWSSVIEYVLSHGIENLSMNLLVGFDSSEPNYAFSKFFNKVLNYEDLILDVVHCDPEDEYKKRFRISGERLVNLKVRFIHFDRIEVYATNLKSFFFHKVDFVHEFLELTLPSLDHVDIMLYGQGFEYLDDLRTHISSLFSAILDYIPKFLQKQISPFTRLKTLVVEDGNAGDEVKNYFMRGRSGEVSEVVKILDYIPKFLQKQISPFTRLKTLVVEDGNVGDEVKNYFMRGRSGEVSEVVKVEIHDRVIEYVLSHGIENLSKNLLVGFDSSEPVYAFSKSFSKVLNDEGMLILKLESMKLDQSFRLQTTGFRLLMKVELVECKYFYDEEVIKPFGGLLCLEDLILDVVHCDPEDEYKKRFRISGERLVNLKVRFIHFDRIEVYAPNLKSFFFHKVDFVNEFLELTLPSLDHVDIMLYGQGFEYLDDLRTHIITFFTGLCTVTSLALDHSTTEILDYILKFLQKQISPFTRLKTLVVEDGNVGDEVKNYFIRGRSGKCQKWSRIEVYATNLKSFFFHKVDFVHEFLELTLPSLDHVDIMLYGQALPYLVHLSWCFLSFFAWILDYIPKFLQKQISPFTRLKTLVVEDGNAGDEVKNYFMRGRSGEVLEVVKVEICDRPVIDQNTCYKMWWGTCIGCEAYNTLKRVIEYVLSHGIENLSVNLLVGFHSSKPVYAFSKLFSKVLNDEGMLILKLESMKLDQSVRIQTTGFLLLMKVELVECKYFSNEEVIEPFGGFLCLEDLILDVVHCDPEDEYKKRFRISGERLVNLKVRFIHFDRIEVYAPNLKSFFFHKVDFVHEFLELTLPSLDHVDITLYGQGFEYLDDLRTHISSLSSAILDYIPKFLQKQISPFTRLKTLVVEDGNVGDEVKNYFMRGRSGEVSEVVKWGTGIGCEAYNTLKRVIEYVLSHGIENLSVNLLVGFHSSKPVYAFSKLFSKVLNDEGMLILKLESMKLNQSFRLQTTGFRLLMKVELVECKYFYDEEVIKPFGGLLCLEYLILDVVHCDPEDEYKKKFRISGERLVNLKVRFIHFDRIEVYEPNLKSFFFHKVDFVHEFLQLTLHSLDHVDITLYSQGFEYLDDLRTHIITFFSGLCTVTSLPLDHSTTEILDYILKFLQKQISPITRLKTLVVEDGNVGDEVKNYFIRGRSGEVSEVVKWGTGIGCEAHNTLKRVIEYVLSHGIENLSMNLLVGFDSSEPIYAFSKFFNKVLNDEDLILDVVHCDPEVEYKKRFRISGERLVNLKVRFIHFDRIEVYAPNLKSFFFHKVDFVHEFLELTLPSLDHVDITLYGQGFEYLDDLRTHISSLSSAILDYIPKFLQKQISPFTRLKTLVVEDGNVGDEVKNYFMRGRSGEVSEVVKWGTGIGCEAYNTLKRVIEYVLSHGIENLSVNLLVGFHSSKPVYAFSKLFSKVLNDEGMLILKLESMKLNQSFRLQTTGFRLLMKVELVECKYFYDEEVIKPFGGLLCLEYLILDVVHCDPEDEYKKRFRISGERLVNLKVRFIHFNRIEVYEPNLKSFFFHKVDFVHEFLQLTLHSLDHVDITLYSQGFEYLDDLRTHIITFFSGLCTVTSLPLDHSTTEILDYILKFLQKQISPFTRLKTLVVEDGNVGDEILDYILKFLQKQISPFTRLKTLVVEDGYVGDEVKNYFIRGRSGEVSEVVKVEIRDRW
ncbi:hypothetical protein LINPERPRIM_LOCUS36575 [Linum perenne]